MKAKDKLSARSIQRYFYRTQVLLIALLVLIMGFASILINTCADTARRDRSLQNIAETVARSQLLTDGAPDPQQLADYLNALMGALTGVDVISVVSRDNIRLYHSTAGLIGTAYNGTLPNFSGYTQKLYAENDKGPSGAQRRVYAAIYDANGAYVGFVMAIALTESIRAETMRTVVLFGVITLMAIIAELFLSALFSKRIRKAFHGYEPDVFSAMYTVRDSILESLAEGIVAVNTNSKVQFSNSAAEKMLEKSGISVDALSLEQTLQSGDTDHGIRTSCDNILIDRIPIMQDGETLGAVGILHDRAEYTKLMEDLSGTRYLVDSMRANNHDFTNKLHVILGFLQTGLYEEAEKYIQGIAIVRRESIGAVMRMIDEPAIAALVIGKMARAAELNVQFRLQEESRFRNGQVSFPTSALVSIIGNLIDNALDAMNDVRDERPRELLLGIYTKPGDLLITVEDTGTGIAVQDRTRVFENGFTTKGDGHGTGLYQIKNLIEQLGGTIDFETQEDIGTIFSVELRRRDINV